MKSNIKNKILFIFLGTFLLISFNIAIAQDESIELPEEYKKMLDSAKDKNLEDLNPEKMVEDLLPMDVNLSYSPMPVLADKPVQVTAQVISSAGSQELTYRWFLDGKEQNEKSSSFQFNMKNGLVQKELRCGDTREVKAEVTNKATNKKALGNIKIPVGLNLNFSKQTIAAGDLNNPESYNFNLHNANIPYQNIILPSPDIFLSISSQQEQFRYGDIVEIGAINFRDNYDNKACNTSDYTSYDEFVGSLNFKWTFNDIEQQGKNGPGEGFQRAYFLLNSQPTRTVQNNVTACANPDSAVMQGIDKVKLEILNIDGNLLASQEEYLPVTAPSINLESNCEASGKNIQCLKLNTTNVKQSTIIPSYQLNPGQETAFQAILGNFQPSERFEIVWKSNNEIIYEQTIEEPYSKTITSPIIKMPNQESVIAIDIISYPYNSKNTEQASQKLTLTPDQKRGQSTSMTGSLKRFLPNSFKNFTNFIFVIGIIGIVIAVITYKERRKQ